ncbi:indolepyruvate oxidoreductase subunit beta family protein [Novosphingobium profundi]|uniref:indolepyruvate oxidoreductase subunit beta family protein n=1 Tax=Novosphingobium profundi TaxID=1774954 RepID=UPI001BD952AF|nr:indolepyruvate oxidoreductase subunit beta family protein [Novosphingobium profundi]MBT0670770.1 indolepyruvate oxidoreductase subunit beta family protein [Novosphingobium profundi]
MTAPQALNTDRITIAILALGGQGGGVLADWIQHVARQEGWLAQGTSVPGVAQRTGSTVYYVELYKDDGTGRLPVLAQMPLPGDVDIVIASELMETGRALLRGFSSAGRTTLIGSTHRIYAIGEKQQMGDGRGNGAKIIEAAHQRSKRFIGFDMEAATDRSGSVISAIMFGALAGSGALPFPTETFRAAIEHAGIAVASNFKGFAEGFEQAQAPVAMPEEIVHTAPVPTSEAGRGLAARIARELPEPAQDNALHGVARLMDYQDAAYAGLYLDRLAQVAARDATPFELTRETARHLALWMSYEDTIRVAEIKTRKDRLAEVRREVKAQDDQLLSVTEFMHPRLREVCETLPRGLGERILKSARLSGMLEGFFTRGRHVETTSLRWFLVLRTLAGMRSLRPRSLRYAEEQARIEAWLEAVCAEARFDRNLALEIVRCQRLIKGYGDTFERGLANFEKIMTRHAEARLGAAHVASLRELALSDETCAALDTELATMDHGVGKAERA